MFTSQIFDGKLLNPEYINKLNFNNLWLYIYLYIII